MQHAGAGLQKIVTDTLRRAPTDEAALLAWPLVCGTAVAGKTRALDFTDGVLSVQVPDANWRTQLLGLAPQYLAEVNKFVTKNVRKIAFVIADESAPQRVKAATHS